MRHVLYRVRASAFQFGSWVGAYRGVKCSMQTLRGKRDFLNGAVAGDSLADKQRKSRFMGP